MSIDLLDQAFQTAAQRKPSSNTFGGIVYRSSLAHPCPVCENDKGGCSGTDGGSNVPVLFCIGYEGQTGHGYTFLKNTRDGEWAVLTGKDHVEGDWGFCATASKSKGGTGFQRKSRNWDDTPRISIKPAKVKRSPLRTEKNVRKSMPSVVRASVYKEVQEMCSLSEEALSHPKIRKDVADTFGLFQLTHEAGALLMGHRLLGPGQGTDASLYDRVMVPVFGLGGEIQGFQARALTNDAENKYIWISGGKSGNSIHNSFGEVPLQVVPGTEEPNVLVFVEGALKPLNVWLMARGRYTVIGGIGGNWSGSPKTLDQIIRHQGVSGKKVLPVVLPDAGWQVNPSIEMKVNNLVDHLSRVHGLDATVSNWCHWTDKSKPDPDELDPGHLEMELAATVGEQRPDNSELPIPVVQMLESSWKAPLSYDGGLASTYEVDLDATPSGILDLLSNSKYVLDCSPVGAGKTHSIEDLHKSGLWDRVIYVSQSPRNPATQYIEENAYRPPTRHSGLVDTGLKTPMGKPVLRRPKSSTETLATLGTCSNHVEHLVAMKTGQPAKDVCEACPFFGVCSTGEDPNNNYLFLQKQRGNADLSLISTSSQGLSEWMFEDSRTLLVIDEPSQAMPVYQTVRITVAEMNVLQTILPGAWFRENNRLHYTPSDSTADRQIMVDRDEMQTKKIQLWSKSGKRGAQPSLPNNVDIFNSLTRGGLVEHSGYWEGTCPHTRNLGFVDAASSVLFLDATASPLILSSEWGVEGLRTAGRKDLSAGRVHINVLRCEGFNTSNWFTQPKSKSVANDVINMFPSTYGVVTHGKAGIPGSLTYFSTSRGSNLFREKDGLILLGLPQINLGAAREQYANLINPLFSFDDYYRHLVEAELIQSIGRLRAQRRDRSFEVIVVANATFRGLEKRGFRVTSKSAAEVGVKSAIDRHAEIVLDLVEAVKSGIRGTQNFMAKHIGASSGTLSRCLKRVGLTVEQLFHFFDNMRAPEPRWADLSDEAVEDILRHNGDPYRIRKEHLEEVLNNLGRTGTRGVPRKVWNNLLYQLTFSLGCDIFLGAYLSESISLDQVFGGWDTSIKDTPNRPFVR